MEHRRTGVCIAMLCLTACASTRDEQGEKQPIRRGVRPPSPRALGQHCDKPIPFPDEDLKPMPYTFVITCPLLPMYKWQQVAKFALVPAARLAVLLESEEFYAAPQPASQASHFGLVLYYPSDDADRGWLKHEPVSDLFAASADQILPPEELSALREQVAIQNEDLAYEECRALVLDVNKSTQDPKRAQACTNAMAVVDRARSVRQQTRFLQQQAELAERQREEMERLRLEIEAEQRQEEQGERQRRILRAIGAGLSAYGQAIQNGPTASAYTSQPSAHRRRPAETQQNSRGCSSDFECGFGNVCVKSNFSASGRCMRAVNEYGSPNYSPPRTDSVMPKLPNRSDCKFVTDCPPGFTCDTSSGTCVR